MRRLDGRICEDLASRFGTPLFVVFPDVLRDRLSRMFRATHVDSVGLVEMQFAFKAASSPCMLEFLDRHPIVIDVASEMEFAVARRLGIEVRRLHVYAPGATQEFLLSAFRQGADVTLDSRHQAEQIVLESGQEVGCVYLRVAPSIQLDANDADIVSVGSNKLGILPGELSSVIGLLEAKGISVTGLHAHLGSQVRRASVFRRLAENVAALAEKVGSIDVVNLGGGLPIAYGMSERAFRIDELVGELVNLEARRRDAGGRSLRYRIEPGRALVADGAAMITRVLDVKSGLEGERYAIVDARLNSLGNDLPVIPVSREQDLDELHEVTLVGTACTPHDVIGRVNLSRCEVGDLFVIGQVGAYVLPLEGCLHLRPKGCEIAWEAGSERLLRRRATDVEFLSIAM